MTDQTEEPTKRQQFITLTQDLQASEKQAATDAAAYLGTPEVLVMVDQLTAFQGNMLPSSPCDRALTNILRAIEVAGAALSHPAYSMPAPIIEPAP